MPRHWASQSEKAVRKSAASRETAGSDAREGRAAPKGGTRGELPSTLRTAEAEVPAFPLGLQACSGAATAAKTATRGNARDRRDSRPAAPACPHRFRAPE